MKIKSVFFYFLFIAGLLSKSFITYTQTVSHIFDTYLEAEKDIYHFNGNVLVAKEGNIIYQKSFGYADYDSKAKLDNNSVFDIGSIAKEFTAVAILLLKDKGLLSLSDTLTKFFPQLPYGNVTIRHLLTHTSGMADGFGLVEKYFNPGKIATNNDLINLLAEKKSALAFTPGEDIRYSGTGFNLLASVIEIISAKSYSDFLNEEIFVPLGMSQTKVANFLRSPATLPHYANGFVYNDSLKKYSSPSGELAWPLCFYGITGEGMIVSTSNDLLLWDRSIKYHRLLTANSQAEMLTSQVTRKSIPIIHFGYGMRVEKNEMGNCLFHNGWFPGFKSMHIRYVDDDVTVIVLSNNESQSDFIADGLASIALGKPVFQPVVHKEITIEDSLDGCTGKYSMPLTRPPYMALFPVEINRKKDTLYIHTRFVTDIELKALAANKFFYADGSDQQIEFEKDAAGNVIKTFYTGWGVKREIHKIE